MLEGMFTDSEYHTLQKYFNLIFTNRETRVGEKKKNSLESTMGIVCIVLWQGIILHRCEVSQVHYEYHKYRHNHIDLFPNASITENFCMCMHAKHLTPL